MVESGLPKRSESRLNCIIDLNANRPGIVHVNNQINKIKAIEMEFISKPFFAHIFALFFCFIVLIIEIIFFIELG